MSTRKNPVPPSQDVLGYLLKHATMRLNALTDAALQPHGVDSKDLGILRVMVREDALSQLQVAQALGIDRTTMVSLLDALESRGIVTRSPDPDDRRRNLVQLTSAGAEIYSAGEAVRKAVEGEFLAPLDKASRENLRQSLHILVIDPQAN